ncbi:MAG: hypothetical protein IPN68_16705 [Bacteroidetes bacterium]|nr:hypothetical protein [Bacteroidota bacterium]
MKYWEILLSKQRERGHDGLTLPFLIGAQNYLPETHIIQNVKDLILEMISKNSFETCVRFCTGTQTLFFEIRNKKNSVYFPSYKLQKQDGLSVGVFHRFELGDSIDVLIENMEDKFQKAIDDKKYSAESNVNGREVKWISFTNDKDIPFIKRSFESLYYNFS